MLRGSSSLSVPTPRHMPSIEFLPLAVNPGNYPKSRLSMLPSLARIVWPGREATPTSCAFLDIPEFFVYGRYALVQALKRSGVSPGKVVLLPAYHCRTIVESVLHLGAEVRFYLTKPNLSPDFTVMPELVSDGKVRALLLTHYFGFPNALEEAQNFCAAHDIKLIEDCAHAFYGEQDGQVLGTFGHYSVASAWKFLPLRDGAVLRDNTLASTPVDLRPQPIKAEIKALLAMLELRARSGLGRAKLQEFEAAELVGRARTIAAASVKPAGGNDIQFNPCQVEMAGLASSRWLVAHSAHARVIRRRRENYLHWLAGVCDLPGIRPLFPVLPEGTVPYAFPLLTDTSGLLFHALKLAGIPIWRWEDVAITDCPVARDYRLRLLQLPCHQDLSREEIDWMLRVLRGVLPGLLA